MGAGAFVIACFANAIGSLILMFPIAALVIRGYRRTKLGWGKGFGLLGITILIVAAINFVLFKVEPSLLRATDMGFLSVSQMYLVPLTVSLVVLYMLWRPKAP